MDDWVTRNGLYSVGLLQRSISERFSKGDEIAYSNYFLVFFPEELDITTFDVISIEFIGDDICRFVIRNNYDKCPIFSLNSYRNKCNCFFKRNKDIIEIDYINRKGSIKYQSILKNISIKNIIESKLTYERSDIQTITFDVKYNKREIIKPIKNATN